jgi:hypothetical protein
MDWSRRDLRMDKSQQSARGLGSTPTAWTIGEELVITGNVTSKGGIRSMAKFEATSIATRSWLARSRRLRET